MQLKKYTFEFNVLDDQGNERHQRLANDPDVVELLEGSGETSPSEHIHALVLAEIDRFPTMKYTDAVQRVRNRNPKLFRIYASESEGRVRVYAANAARAG